MQKNKLILPEEVLEFIVLKLDNELDADLNAQKDFLEMLQEGELRKLKPIIRFSCANILVNIEYDKSLEDCVYQEIITALKIMFAEEIAEIKPVS